MGYAFVEMADRPRCAVGCGEPVENQLAAHTGGYVPIDAGLCEDHYEEAYDAALVAKRLCRRFNMATWIADNQPN